VSTMIRNLFASTRCHMTVLVLVIAVAPAALASGPYVIGSSNTVTADPTVPRPTTTPCVVTLFTDYTFDNNFNLNPFSYTPPEDCPGPWAKVVLEVDISVTAGNQFDRTANIWLGGTNIFFGTTSEPGPTLAPSWHVESDLTDYSPLFTVAQTGSIYLGNTVNSTYTSIQSVTATLEFYPLTRWQPAPVTANVVLPLSSGPLGGTVTLNTGTNTLTGTFTLPKNIERAYLDVYSQGQIGDEFWYTCVPNDVATELQSCGNTGFRETEITIDGQPAGVAPVSPWIFTGGIDPFLWFPIPGVQTLNFVPYRVDLTPFAGVLSNGQEHTVSVSVFNANDYFSDTATLLLYLDPHAQVVSGEVTKNTLAAAPTPVVSENLKVNGANITGTVNVTSKRHFVISGYVNTSHGRVTTTLAQNLQFGNDQTFNINSTTYVQDVQVNTNAFSTTTVSEPNGPSTTYSRFFQFPATIDYDEFTESNGDVAATTKISQNYQDQRLTRFGSWPVAFSQVTNAGQYQDTLNYVTFVNSNQSANQHYSAADSSGYFYLCDVQDGDNELTKFSPTCAK
jgi:Peptide N-acetyl-beta-D-glucosaminyl asparaginase amidase A